MSGAIRTRNGLKWGIPAMLIAVPYFALAYWCTTLIDASDPGWLHLIVLVACWSGLKFIVMGAGQRNPAREDPAGRATDEAASEALARRG